MAARRTLRCALAALAICAWPVAAQALTPLKSIRYAPDITVVLGGTTVKHNQVAQDNLAGLVTLVNVGAIPPDAGITAYDQLHTGPQLLAFDVPVSLPGGVTARPGDVVRFDGATYALVFDAAANGIPAGVITDAVSQIGPNDLLLSFDVTVAVGGITAQDEDLVRVRNGAFSLFFDGSAAGIGPGLDLDAAHCIDSNAHLLLAFDGSGTVAGVDFTQADVLEFTPTSVGWELSYDGEAQHAGWSGAELHGISAVVNPPPPPVAPAFSGGGSGVLGAGVFPGSSRVFGRGMVHAKPGDTCIGIFAAGANGAPDAPPGSVDDELLGSGGTDINGNLVDAMDNPGIPLSRPLRPGDRVFVADLCEGLVGAVAVIRVSAAPVLSVYLLAVMGALLAGLGVRRLNRARSAA